MTVLVSYEDILWSPRRNSAITEGENLLRTLLIGKRVVLLTELDRARVEHHMMVSGITMVADIVDKSVEIPDQPLRYRQIEIERAKGSVEMVVTPDPAVAEWVVRHGMLALFFAHPSYAEPMRRPEAKNKSWDDLVQAVEERAVERAKKERK